MTAASTLATPPSQAEESPRKATLPSARVYFVDVLRLIASFQMVNGHTLDAVMLESIRGGSFYDRYLWFRGLVSVAFLVVAGIAFHLSTLCRYEKHKGNPAAIRRRFLRAGFIILVGYFLHFPWSAFSGDPERTRQALDYFKGVDVLHCIGLALLFMEVATLVSKRPGQVVAFCGVLASGLIVCAPLTDSILLGGESHALFNWISHQGGSAFPLLPWAGFVFAGLVIGAVTFPQGGHTPFKRVLSRLSVLAALSFAISLLEAVLGGQIYDPTRHHASTNPFFSFQKLAAVLAFLVLLALVCQPIKKLPRFLSQLSRETLAIYAIHLILLFYPGLAIAKRFDHRLDLGASFATSAVMMVLTLGSTLLWHRFKTKRAEQRVRSSSST